MGTSMLTVLLVIVIISMILLLINRIFWDEGTRQRIATIVLIIAVVLWLLDVFTPWLHFLPAIKWGSV
jgi:hypothetical protein